MQLLSIIIGEKLKSAYRMKSMLLVYAVIIVMSGIMVLSLKEKADEGIVLTLGYIDESQSEASEQIISVLKEHQFLITKEIDLDHVEDLIRDGKVFMAVRFPENLEEDLEENKNKDLIEIYYMENDLFSPMMSEITISELMDEISIETAMNYLKRLTKDRENQEEILENGYALARTYQEDVKENYYVDIKVVDVEKQIVKEEVIEGNTLFKQIIYGIILTFINLVITYGGVNVHKDCRNMMLGKVMMTGANGFFVVAGHYLSILLTSSPIVLILGVIIGYGSNSTYKFVFYLMLYAINITGIIQVMAYAVKSLYNYIMLTVIGGLFLNIIGGVIYSLNFAPVVIKKLSELVPGRQIIKSLLNLNIYGAYAEKINIVSYVCVYVGISLILAFSIFKRKKDGINSK